VPVDAAVQEEAEPVAFVLADSGGAVYVTSLLHKGEPRQISARV